MDHEYLDVKLLCLECWCIRYLRNYGFEGLEMRKENNRLIGFRPSPE